MPSKQAGLFPYFFTESRLYYEALTHSSFLADNNQENINSNERLEYLGDAVLKLTISEYLYKRFENIAEGKLSKYRASLISDKLLARIAKDYNISEHLIIGRTMQNKKLPDSIIGNVVEALIAVIYIEQGFQKASEFILEIWQDYIEDCIDNSIKSNYKALLIEKIQSEYGKSPIFETTKTFEKNGTKQFEISVIFDGKALAKASSANKKEASQNAAKLALEDTELKHLKKEA